MPIKDKSLYPPDWAIIREEIRTRAHDRCEGCGVLNHAYGWRDQTGLFHPTETDNSAGELAAWPKIIRIVCTGLVQYVVEVTDVERILDRG